MTDAWREDVEKPEPPDNRERWKGLLLLGFLIATAAVMYNYGSYLLFAVIVLFKSGVGVVLVGLLCLWLIISMLKSPR